MNKPKEFTSFDVIGKLRGILRIRRLGHTGTLDPMATGVLPILVGTATKACDILPNQDKTYQAQVQFGYETDTQDRWGKTIRTASDMHVTRTRLEDVLPRFIGEISQIPPMYSAVSVGGQRLYELARKGIEVERSARTVTVSKIMLDAFSEERQTATLTIFCGKGVYIRTLISDIGQALGGCAVMTELTRTMACGYTLEQAYSFEQVEQMMQNDSLAAHLIPTETLFQRFPALHLGEAQSRMYQNGVKLDLSRLRNIQPNVMQYRVYDAAGRFVGTAQADLETGLLRVGKNFGTC